MWRSRLPRACFVLVFEKREETGNKIDAGDVVIDLERRSTAVLGDEIELTPTEFRLLAYFIECHGRTVSRDQIIENVFGYDFSGYDRTVDTHVSNLRKKLEVANPNKQHLKASPKCLTHLTQNL